MKISIMAPKNEVEKQVEMHLELRANEDGTVSLMGYDAKDFENNGTPWEIAVIYESGIFLALGIDSCSGWPLGPGGCLALLDKRPTQ